MWEKMAHIENIGYKHRKEWYKHACIADESKTKWLVTTGNPNYRTNTVVGGNSQNIVFKFNTE